MVLLTRLRLLDSVKLHHKTTALLTYAQLFPRGWPPPAAPAQAEWLQAPAGQGARYRPDCTCIAVASHQQAGMAHAQLLHLSLTRMPLGWTAREAPRGRSVERSNTATRRSGLQQWLQSADVNTCGCSRWQHTITCWCCHAFTESTVAHWPQRRQPSTSPRRQQGVSGGQPAWPAAHHRHVQLLVDRTLLHICWASS